ncbi:MAG: VanZ family protein [Candidatus Coatesbacteria bacterium]|nr:VanZ family protein [Candidatus Coatesbacteria bacterium]
MNSGRQRPFGRRKGLTDRPLLVWAMLIGYCGLVFVGSSISNVPRELNKVPDYVLHFIEYFIMGLLAHIAFRTRPVSFSPKMAATIATLFCLAYAVSDEFHQYFVKSRYASLPDIAADFLGGLFAQIIILFLIFLRRAHRRRAR